MLASSLHSSLAVPARHAVGNAPKATMAPCCSARLTPFTSKPLRAAPRTPKLFSSRTSRLVVKASAEVDVDVEEDAMEKMEKSLESVKRSFVSIRTGRANPAMLDRIEVEYYGAPTPLKQIAGISVPESSMLVIQPYDQSALNAIERAIMQSDLGLTPNNDGRIIRLSIPALTGERRKEMTKMASRLGEEGKVAIRNVRRDAMKAIDKLEKDGSISEDGKAGLEEAVQDLTDEYIKQVDALIKSKQAELSAV